jgi:hypothetical protein
MFTKKGLIDCFD